MRPVLRRYIDALLNSLTGWKPISPIVIGMGGTARARQDRSTPA
jgi:hypothetical protein